MHCPITGYPVTTQVTIHKWKFYLIFVSLQTYEVDVSNEGKRIFYKNYSLGRQIFDSISKTLIQIPLIGGLLILCLFSIMFLYGSPITAGMDWLADIRIFGRGGLRIGSNGELLHNYPLSHLNDEDHNRIDISKSTLDKYFRQRKKNLYVYSCLIIILVTIMVIIEEK